MPLSRVAPELVERPHLLLGAVLLPEPVGQAVPEAGRLVAPRLGKVQDAGNLKGRSTQGQDRIE